MLEDNNQIREDLEKSKASLTEAQRIAHLGNWDWDTINNELHWSDEIYRIFGLKPQEFGATYEAFLNSVHPDDRDLVKKSVNEALSEKKSFRIDHRIVLPDGEVRFVREEGEVTFDENNESVRMIGTVQDITEHRLLQDQLIQSEKLAAVGELVSGVAHEINNPLTAVVGFAQLLKKHENGLGEDERKQLEIIWSEGERVRKIVSNLLSFARKQKPEKKPLDVNSLVETVLDMRSYELGISNINMVKEFDAKLPRVEADAQQIEQVFLNMVNNAQQAMIETHGKGNLTIRTYTSDNVVRIEFVDDGPGIAKEDLKKIFDPFFTTKEAGKGTGLGLSVSYGIIKEHNGNIFVESEQGKGARFIIELPFVAGDSDEKGKDSHS